MSKDKEVFIGEFQIVDIDRLIPNDWNPKDDINENEANMKEYLKVKKSIELNGFNDPVDVREVELEDGKDYDGLPYLQICDGFHRYLALKDLNYTKVAIINHGAITRSQAQALTFQREKIKVVTNEVMVADMISQMYEENDQDFQAVADMIAIETDEIKDYLEMSDFDWNNFQESKQQEFNNQGGEQFQSTGKKGGEQEPLEEQKFEAMMSDYHLKKLNTVLNLTKQVYSCSTSEALYKISEHYESYIMEKAQEQKNETKKADQELEEDEDMQINEEGAFEEHPKNIDEDEVSGSEPGLV